MPFERAVWYIFVSSVRKSHTALASILDVSFEKAEGERLGVFLREKDIGHDVCVNTVADDSPAYLELSPGDIIEAVNGVRVKSAVQ